MQRFIIVEDREESRRVKKHKRNFF